MLALSIKKCVCQNEKYNKIKKIKCHALYVARNKRSPSQHDVGSVICLNTVREIPPNHVTVVDCSVMLRRPTYLRGTPTLIDDESGEAWTGHNAIQRLQRLALFHAQEHRFN